MRGFTASDIPDQTGKCIMVSGANTGIGFEVARALAAKGARVLLACRSKARADAAMKLIRAETPTADLVFVSLDLADLESVRACARAVEAMPRLDVLINNAGVMFPPLRRTAQGRELQFGINHIGCFALSCLLLPKLEQASDPRIVVTSSLAHWRARIRWDDLDAHRSYRKSQRYSDSKLMNLLFVQELDRRLQAAGSPVKAIGCHPGVAATELVRHMPRFARALWPVFTALLNSAEMGAWPALQAATGPDVVAGEYYGPRGIRGARGDSGPNPRSKAAQNPDYARWLWDISVALTKIDPGLDAVNSKWVGSG